MPDLPPHIITLSDRLNGVHYESRGRNGHFQAKELRISVHRPPHNGLRVILEVTSQRPSKESPIILDMSYDDWRIYAEAVLTLAERMRKTPP